MPFRLISSSGSNPTYLANVTGGSEVFTLPKSPAAGLKITIVREDASGNTATVQARTGVTLDGTLAGSTTVSSNGEKSFLSTGSGKWESIGGGGGGGGGGTPDDGSVTTAKLAAPLAATIAGKADASSLPGTYAGQLKATGSKTAAYTAALSELVRVNASGGAVTITAPGTAAIGQTFAVTKTDSSVNAVTVVDAASKTFNGDPSTVIVSQWAGAVFAFDGTNWIIQSVMSAAATSAVTSVVGQSGSITGSQILADTAVANALNAKLTATASAADSVKVGGVAISGTPTAGQIPKATSSSAAAWGDAPSTTPADGSVTPAKLSTGLTTTLNGKANTTDLPTIYARPVGPLTSFLGDSITGLGGANSIQTSDCYSFYACANSGGKITYGDTWSYSGQTTATILAGLPTNLTNTPWKPSRVIVMGGTNDVGANVPTATSLANLQAMYVMLLNNGIRPVACTIPPRGDSSTANALAEKLNVGIRRMAQRMGLDLLDFHGVLVDRTTGGFKAGLALSDNIHPSWLGSSAMGKYAATQLSGRLNATAVGGPARVGDTSDIFAGKGLFLATVQSDGTIVGYDYEVHTGHTASVTTDSGDGTKWQRLTLSSDSGATGQPFFRFAVTGACAPGDVLELTGRIRTSGFDAVITPNNGAGASFSLSVEINATGGNVYGGAANVIHSDVADGVVSIRATAPATATGQVRLNLQAGKPPSGTCWVEFTGLAVRNLTALGLLAA